MGPSLGGVSHGAHPNQNRDRPLLRGGATHDEVTDRGAALSFCDHAVGKCDELSVPCRPSLLHMASAWGE